MSLYPKYDNGPVFPFALEEIPASSHLLQVAHPWQLAEEGPGPATGPTSSFQDERKAGCTVAEP